MARLYVSNKDESVRIFKDPFLDKMSYVHYLTPLIVFAVWNITQFPFGGTSLLITVGVALETMKQIDSQLMMRNYEGFLA